MQEKICRVGSARVISPLTISTHDQVKRQYFTIGEGQGGSVRINAVNAYSELNVDAPARGCIV